MEGVVMNKITCICLGVKDMERSIKFYRDGLGYKTDCKENNPPVCFSILQEQNLNYFLWNN